MANHHYCLAWLMGGLLWFGATGAVADTPTQEPQGTTENPMAASSDSAADNGSLQITLQEAVLMALENNRSLLVERLRPDIRQTYEQEARAAFDPTVTADVAVQRSQSERQARTGGGTESYESDGYQGGIALKNFFPTGTHLEVGVTTEATDSTLYDTPFAASRVGLSLTQSLLRGFGRDVNLAQLRQARLETAISQYELRGFSEALLAQVEDAYWDYALSLRQIEIVEESLKLARQQLAETEAMIQVGTMAESELAAVQAEVATQEQGLINVQSALQTNRLRLLRLLNPPGAPFWNRGVTLVHPPVVPEVKLDAVEDHVALGLRLRPEINQAKMQIQQGDLEIVHTKSGLLPRLDLFITLGRTGYADSFGESLSDISAGDGYDAAAGLNLEYPLRNRAAQARHRRALLNREQSAKALDNLAQLVELDVRSAYIEVNRTRQQITASTATRKLQDEKLRVETEKFRVGRSTNLLVAQAQRDLLGSRISEVQAIVNYLKALTHLFRLEGSLLERRGIKAPGRETVLYPAGK